MNFLLYYVQIFWSKRWNFAHKYIHTARRTHTRESDEKKNKRKNALAHLHTHNRKNFSLSFFPSLFFFVHARPRAPVCWCAFLCNISFFTIQFDGFSFRSFIHFSFFSLNRRCSTCTERIFNTLFFIFFFLHFILFTSIQVLADFFAPPILSFWFTLGKPVYFFFFFSVLAPV